MSELTFDLRVLRRIAHDAGEDRDNRDGWCRWGTRGGDPWEWDDYRSLLAAGLIEKRETWKDVLLRPTDAGWEAVAHATDDRLQLTTSDGWKLWARRPKEATMEGKRGVEHTHYLNQPMGPVTAAAQMAEAAEALGACDVNRETKTGHQFVHTPEDGVLCAACGKEETDDDLAAELHEAAQMALGALEACMPHAQAIPRLRAALSAARQGRDGR